MSERQELPMTEAEKNLSNKKVVLDYDTKYKIKYP